MVEMKNKPPAESPYFAVQASWGMTKHLGGLKATEKLAELCRIDQGKHVLVEGAEWVSPPVSWLKKLTAG
jgi:hypothetical protein